MACVSFLDLYRLSISNLRKQKENEITVVTGVMQITMLVDWVQTAVITEMKALKL